MPQHPIDLQDSSYNFVKSTSSSRCVHFKKLSTVCLIIEHFALNHIRQHGEKVSADFQNSRHSVTFWNEERGATRKEEGRLNEISVPE